MKSRTEKGNAPEVAATEASSEVSQTTKKGTIVSDSTVAPTNSQPVFNFGDNQVRVIVRDGNPWFVAADVCAVLGVKNHRDSLMHLDDDEKGVVLNDTLGGKQQISVVNESGLYALVLRSRKPEAKKFTKWVTSEVLPSIRKTGQYTATPYTVQPGETLPDMHRTRAAFDAAAQAAASVQTAVFNAVLSGNDEWKSGRWMLAFIDDSAKAAPAYVQQMERGTFVTTWPRLVRDVASGECLRSSAELVAMANACTTRLQQSMSQEASQCRCIPENGTGTTKENTQCLTV